MLSDWEERYDIRDARQSSFVGGMKMDGYRIYYSVRFVEFDFGDERLPADIESNWRAYEFVKIWRDNKYVGCELRRKS
jgi:hypothetical protein